MIIVENQCDYGIPVLLWNSSIEFNTGYGFSELLSKCTKNFEEL